MPHSMPSGIPCSRLPYKKTVYVICLMYTLNIPHDRVSSRIPFKLPFRYFIEYTIAHPIDNDLNKENQEEPHRFWAGVAVRHASMCERSLQSPNEIHSSRDVRLLFFQDRKMQKSRGFLSTTTNDARTFRQILLSEHIKCYIC